MTDWSSYQRRAARRRLYWLMTWAIFAVLIAAWFAEIARADGLLAQCVVIQPDGTEWIVAGYGVEAPAVVFQYETPPVHAIQLRIDQRPIFEDGFD